MSNPPALPRATPESHGLGSAAINDFLDAIGAQDDLEPHSLMILRHGTVLAEGWWHPYEPDRVHLLYSLSKSFTSVAAGMAAAEGTLDLDARIVDVFSEHADAATDPRARAITLRHCLRMATGHRTDALAPALESGEDDLVRGFLTVAPDEEPGSIFCYNNAAPFTVAAAIQKLTGESLTDYLRPRLFEPLGIEPGYWQQDRHGREIGFSGLHLRTESIARFGQLIISGGVWQGKQLIDPDYLAAATSAQTANPDEPNPDWRQGYGYQFWMARHGFRGDGAYGQFCLILPEQDAVIAMTSGTTDLQGVLDAVWTHLQPAFAAEPLPEADSSRLTDRLAALQLPAVGSPAWQNPPVPEPTLPGAPAELLRVTKIESADDHLITVDHDPESPGRPVIPLTFRCGDGRWATGEIERDGQVLAYAASGSWTAADVFDAELSFVQTPHRVRLRHHRGGRTESGWLTEPLRSRYPEHLATPR